MQKPRKAHNAINYDNHITNDNDSMVNTRMSNKTLRFSGIMLVLLGLVSCSKYKTYSYKLAEFELSNQENSGRYPVDVITDTIPAKTYAIKMTYTATFSQEDDYFIAKIDNTAMMIRQ